MVCEVNVFNHNYCNFILVKNEFMQITQLLCAFLLITTSLWEDDFQLAQSKANNSEKYLVVYFSGSDWCANCYRFKKSVLEDDQFNQFASENLVLYNADFPRKRKNQLSESKQNANNELARLYNKDSVFPKIVMIDGDGNLISDFNGITFENGASDFINHAKLKLAK